MLQAAAGPLSAQLQLLASIISLVPLGRLLSAHRASTGRPAKDRAPLATAFIAKAVLNLPTTRDLIDRLRVDQALRQFCGWRSLRALPNESKFSHAFAEFAATELPQQLHEAVIAATQSQRLIGHIARDSTAIPARERFPEAAKEKQRASRKPKSKRAPGSFSKPKPAGRGTGIPRQRHQKMEQMMSERVNARLKDEFGGSHIRVRGAAKVMAHLMLGVLALTVDQWLRISATG